MNRAERRANNQRVIKNRLKELKDLGDSRHNYLATKSNKLSKQDAFDCGQTKCPLCSSEKLYGNRDNKGHKTAGSNTYKVDVLDELDIYNSRKEI